MPHKTQEVVCGYHCRKEKLGRMPSTQRNHFNSIRLVCLSLMLPRPPHLIENTDRQEAAEVIAGGKLNEEQTKELFDKVDTDKSGVIEYEEFKQVC